ncbi:MAG: hypothetical protein WC250_04010, partial [Candidatus Paceibacterota bacterium]
RMTTTPWHPECRSEFLEDLLARVKSVLETGQTLPKALAKKIRAEKFRTKREFERLRRVDADRQIKKQMHNLAKLDFMQKAGAEFDRKNPDPNPSTYASKIG